MNDDIPAILGRLMPGTPGWVVGGLVLAGWMIDKFKVLPRLLSARPARSANEILTEDRKQLSTDVNELIDRLLARTKALEDRLDLTEATHRQEIVDTNRKLTAAEQSHADCMDQNRKLTITVAAQAAAYRDLAARVEHMFRTTVASNLDTAIKLSDSAEMPRLESLVAPEDGEA